MSTKALFPCGGESNLILGTGMENQMFILRTPAAIKCFHQIPKNCHFGVKKSFPSQMDLYSLHVVPTLFPRAIIIFQGVLTKFYILTKFLHKEKFVDLMKNLKYEHKSTFPSGEGSNLFLGTGTENQIIILRTPAAIKFFHQILKKWHFGVKKIITHSDGFV